MHTACAHRRVTRHRSASAVSAVASKSILEHHSACAFRFFSHTAPGDSATGRIRLNGDDYAAIGVFCCRWSAAISFFRIVFTMLNSMKNDDQSIERARIIIEDGCNVPLDKKHAKNLPEWFDEELFTRGQKYFYANFYAMFVSNLIGLILVLTVPTILDVLILTKKSSEPYTAFRRYIDTIKHMLRWYKYDVKNLRSKSQKSVTIVHGLHCAASRTSEKSGLGLRVTQKDMALTQFGFVGMMLLRKKELAIIGTDEDEMGIIHFWKTIGYMLGIEDQYNLCLGTLEEVRGVCAVILRDVYAPALKNPPKEFDSMVEALIEGMKPVSPMLDFDAFTTYTFEMCGVCGVGQRLTTRYSRWMYNVQIYTHHVLLTKRWLAFVFRPLLNYNMMFSVWVNITFPFGAAFKFGTKVFSRVQDHHHHHHQQQQQQQQQQQAPQQDAVPAPVDGRRT